MIARLTVAVVVAALASADDVCEESDPSCLLQARLEAVKRAKAGCEIDDPADCPSTCQWNGPEASGDCGTCMCPEVAGAKPRGRGDTSTATTTEGGVKDDDLFGAPGEGGEWEPDDEDTVERLDRGGDMDVGPEGTTASTTRADPSLVDASTSDVSCGGHRAETCAECPMGFGRAWCNGDCSWQNGQCVLPEVPDLTPENPFACPPPVDGVWPGGDCYARAGSIHFNFRRPQGARQPRWYYNEVRGRASTPGVTFYATNTHGYGYAGIQARTPTDRVVICSTWDQTSGNARMERCGDGVSCSGFGGEGTGAKALWQFQWVDDRPYAMMLRRALLDNGRVEHTCWFHAEELEYTHPGGWKLIARSTSGRNHYGDTFRDSGAFVEQWTHLDSHILRRAQFGSAWYRDLGGVWLQSRAARFSPYCLPERVRAKRVRCDYVSAGVRADTSRLFMATGGLQPPPDHLDDPRSIEYPQAPPGLPAPAYGFEVHKQTLIAASEGSPSPESVSCGGHRASGCPACPFTADGYYHGATWCNGACTWYLASHQCVRRGTEIGNPQQVSCGGHLSPTCAECPQGNGAAWCNGQCRWRRGSCRDK